MAPHLVEQLVLRDHAVAVLDEVREDVEDLRLDVLGLVVAVQRVASGVDHRVAEHVPHRGIVVGVATGGILSGWPMVRLPPPAGPTRRRSSGTWVASASSKRAERESRWSPTSCPPSPLRVLDLGCGDGRLTAVVLEARPSVEEVVAVDRSAPMLDLARTLRRR